MWSSNIRAGIIGGETYVAGMGDELNDEDVAGFAVWFGPGQGFHLTEDQRKNSGYEELSKKRSPENRKWEEEVLLPMCETLDEKTIGSSAKLASYHLQFLAVAPESQGKGIGKALVMSIQSQADKLGVDTCLETATELNISIYKRMGYTVLDSITIPSTWGDSPFHFMHRRANAPIPDGAVIQA
ncbi:hypothetical protein BD410DRAFT_790364 [Rickenella mellea]|uniref:N-acetyltransferase domain-containing protein n=1 Tax=Rickenella mellea TaxID=50990 RepID=A0A4Y7Q0Y1_9AGAM|nr:hypothetical protein BD410DRAFT_790364 [Rickenella mellea]